MANYYGGGGGGRGGGVGYGMGRGGGGGRGYGAPVQGGYQMQQKGPPGMRGGPVQGYDGRGNSNYDYQDTVMEQSWEPVAANARMVPPPSGRHPDADILPQGQGQRVAVPPPRGANQPPPPGPGGAVRYANDCEIIVTAKAQQQYAEMIEKAIKDFHLKVDIMFPKPDVKLAAFIENIASMGTIFAVVIRPDNEAHRSVSVHVLRGCPKPEEHRNMPLAVSYQLIKERYLEIKRKEVGVVPENTKVILRSLTDEKTLTDKEYSVLIKFLQDRRRKLKAFENRTNNVISDGKEDDLLNNPDAEELKQRILEILNGKDATGERVGNLFVPKPTEPLSLGTLSSAPVQSALNNLMQADISTFNTGGLPPQGSSRGMGRGQGQPQGYGRGRGGF